MNNHYHLLVKLNDNNLSKAMRHLNGLFARRYNSMQEKDGPVFKSRYKAVPVVADSYLLFISRRLYLNPVAAKYCLSPEEYLWSSYRYYIQNLDKPKWMFCEAILNSFQKDQAIEHFQQFVKTGLQTNLKVLSYKELNILAKYQNETLSLEENKLYNKNKIIDQKENIQLNKKSDRIIQNTQTIQTIQTATYSTTSNPTSDSKVQPAAKAQSIINASKLASTQSIISKIAEYYNIDPLLIYSNKYRSALNHPRKMAIYMLSQVFLIERRTIAHLIHNVSIDGITKVCQRMKLKLEEDNKLSEEILTLKEYLIQNKIFGKF